MAQHEKMRCTECPNRKARNPKLLALLRIFEQQTDENHLLNVPQLVELLEAQGIRCERKSVYSDIEALGALGYDIKLRRGRGGGYFLASRTFDLAELKLLVDAVQASRVVSGTTSRRLIHKLEKLCSNYEGSQLQRQVYVEGRPKTDSKSLLYSIDALHEAINNGKMVEFLYRKAESREKEKRIVSPWQLAWENGCYYLIAFADEKGIRHYRVDKMSGVRVLDAPRRGQEQFADLDLPAYLRKHFGMYGGPEHRVTLRCTADLEGCHAGSALAQRPCSCPRRMAASILMSPSASATSSTAGSAALAARSKWSPRPKCGRGCLT